MALNFADQIGDKNTGPDYNHHYGYEYDMDGNPIITDAIYSSHNPPHPVSILVNPHLSAIRIGCNMLISVF